MSLSPNNCPALVLNADYQPLSYFPLSTWSWKDALKAVFLDRVNVVSEYNQVVRSPSVEFKLPSVVSLKDYIPLPEKAAFTRFNVFLRDKFLCQYCMQNFKVEESFSSSSQDSKCSGCFESSSRKICAPGRKICFAADRTSRTTSYPSSPPSRAT